MPTARKRMRQVVDWGAALWSGIISGILFFGLNLILMPLATGIGPYTMVQYLASIVMGEDVVDPLAGLDMTVVVVAALSTLVLAIAFTLLVAIIVHRWGLLTGILLGGLLGLALYGINFFTMTWVFPWFFGINGWTLAIIHVIFGAVAGGVYEALEIERFVHTEGTVEATS